MKTKPNGVSAYTVGRAATPAASTPAESNSRTKVSGTPVLAARGVTRGQTYPPPPQGRGIRASEAIPVSCATRPPQARGVTAEGQAARI